jgi:hypothetical protein
MQKRTKRSLVLATVALLIVISTVAATAYVILQWQANTTVAANPQVCFVSWADGTTKANTFTYSCNVFPNIKTVDENITYGVWNWNTTATKSCHLSLASTTTNNTDITAINATIYSGGGQLFTHRWTTLTDTTYYDFTAAANTKYSIWLEIECASGATVGHTPSFTFNMKVENP